MQKYICIIYLNVYICTYFFACFLRTSLDWIIFHIMKKIKTMWSWPSFPKSPRASLTSGRPFTTLLCIQWPRKSTLSPYEALACWYDQKNPKQTGISMVTRNYRGWPTTNYPLWVSTLSDMSKSVRNFEIECGAGSSKKKRMVHKRRMTTRGNMQ